MNGENSLWLQIFLLFILIGINAFFAAAEMAIISLNNQKVKKQAEDGDRAARMLLSLTSEPSRFLATIQVGVTLAGLLASAVASESFADRITNGILASGLPWKKSVIKTVAVMGITILLAYFTLVLGELAPKRLAMQKAEAIARFAVRPLSCLAKIAAPFVRLLSHSTNWVIRLLGGDPAAHEERITEEEIRLMVDVGQERGVIRSTEKEMIDNIFRFDNTTAAEVMTHRVNVVALPYDADGKTVIDTVVREKYSRIPIYRDSMDDIVGILHVQDLVAFLKDSKGTVIELKSLMKEPYFVPFAKKTDELLRELQKNKHHMAVVIDEYGGTAGIVTIEDLLEEIVGSIFDERDEEIQEIEKIDERTFLVSGTVNLETVAELLDTPIIQNESDTLGGFVMAGLGRIPDDDEHPVLHYQGIAFRVEELDERRIAKVKITKM